MKGLTEQERAMLADLRGYGPGDCADAEPTGFFTKEEEETIARLVSRGLVSLPVCRKDPTHTHPQVTPQAAHVEELVRLAGKG